MTRAFPKSVKRSALRRAEGRCEATGPWYGLAEGERCNAPLSYGVEFDHLIAFANGGTSDLDNCICACIRCHKIKTTKRDTPLAAKTLRQQDRNNGIRNTSRGFRGWRKFDGTLVWR